MLKRIFSNFFNFTNITSSASISNSFNFKVIINFFVIILVAVELSFNLINIISYEIVTVLNSSRVLIWFFLVTTWQILYLNFFLIFNIKTAFKVGYKNTSNVFYLILVLYTYLVYYTKILVSFLVSYIFYIFNMSRVVLFNFIITELRSKLLTTFWYPLFKRHSIFGYYRIARQNWVELRTEEVNYIKY